MSELNLVKGRYRLKFTIHYTAYYSYILEHTPHGFKPVQKENTLPVNIIVNVTEGGNSMKFIYQKANEHLAKHIQQLPQKPDQFILTQVTNVQETKLAGHVGKAQPAKVKKENKG